MEDDEKNALLMFLEAQRSSVLAIIDGLDLEALTTPLVPSGWTPLGLLEHLGYAERHWFQEIATGSAEPLPWPDDHLPLTTPRAPAAVFAVPSHVHAHLFPAWTLAADTPAGRLGHRAAHHSVTSR